MYSVISGMVSLTKTNKWSKSIKDIILTSGGWGETAREGLSEDSAFEQSYLVEKWVSGRWSRAKALRWRRTGNIEESLAGQQGCSETRVEESYRKWSQIGSWTQFFTISLTREPWRPRHAGWNSLLCLCPASWSDVSDICLQSKMGPPMLLQGDPRVGSFQLSASFSGLRHTGREQQLLKLKDAEWAHKAPCFTPGFVFLPCWDWAKFHPTLKPAPEACLCVPQWVCVTVAHADGLQKSLGSWLCWRKPGVLCHGDCNWKEVWIIDVFPSRLLGGKTSLSQPFRSCPVSILFSAALFQTWECLHTLLSARDGCHPLPLLLNVYAEEIFFSELSLDNPTLFCSLLVGSSGTLSSSGPFYVLF